MIPLLILWCGIGETTKTVIIVLASFFPMYLSIVKGFTGCDKNLLEVGEVFGYSGGMQQRVAIARALTYNPSFIMMDEPFAALDYFTRTQMQKELLRLQQERGASICFVTHNIDEALLLGHEDVDYVSMSIPEAKAALDGGSIDVALVAGATAYQAGQQGYHMVKH